MTVIERLQSDLAYAQKRLASIDADIEKVTVQFAERLTRLRSERDEEQAGVTDLIDALSKLGGHQ